MSVMKIAELARNKINLSQLSVIFFNRQQKWARLVKEYYLDFVKQTKPAIDYERVIMDSKMCMKIFIRKVKAEKKINASKIIHNTLIHYSEARKIRRILLSSYKFISKLRIYIKRWKLFKETQHKIVGKMFEEIISQIQRQSVMKKLSTKSNSIEVYQYLRFFTKDVREKIITKYIREEIASVRSQYFEQKMNFYKQETQSLSPTQKLDSSAQSPLNQEPLPDQDPNKPPELGPDGSQAGSPTEKIQSDDEIKEVIKTKVYPSLVQEFSMSKITFNRDNLQKMIMAQIEEFRITKVINNDD